MASNTDCKPDGSVEIPYWYHFTGTESTSIEMINKEEGRGTYCSSLKRGLYDYGYFCIVCWLFSSIIMSDSFLLNLIISFNDKINEVSRLGQTLKVEKHKCSGTFSEAEKTASISEPRFGGHRKLTNGWVSVRCPPNRGSENEPVSGFSF